MAKYAVSLSYIDLSDDESDKIGYVICDTDEPDKANHMPMTVGKWFEIIEAHMKMKHGQRDEEATG